MKLRPGVLRFRRVVTPPVDGDAGASALYWWLPTWRSQEVPDLPDQAGATSLYWWLPTLKDES